jgi:hypothetical protein
MVRGSGGERRQLCGELALVARAAFHDTGFKQILDVPEGYAEVALLPLRRTVEGRRVGS